MNNIKSDEFTPIYELKPGQPRAIDIPKGMRRGYFQLISLHYPNGEGHKHTIGQAVFVNSIEINWPHVILADVRTLKISDLACNDALALGIEGPGPLEKLKSLLRKRFKENARWRNGNTEVDILTFEVDG